jgi:hypothetical protein
VSPRNEIFGQQAQRNWWIFIYIFFKNWLRFDIHWIFWIFSIRYFFSIHNRISKKSWIYLFIRCSVLSRHFLSRHIIWLALADSTACVVAGGEAPLSDCTASVPRKEVRERIGPTWRRVRKPKCRLPTTPTRLLLVVCVLNCVVPFWTTSKVSGLRFDDAILIRVPIFDNSSGKRTPRVECGSSTIEYRLKFGIILLWCASQVDVEAPKPLGGIEAYLVASSCTVPPYLTYCRYSAYR